MKHTIIKVDLDADLFMVWSSGVDNAVYIGSRGQVEEAWADLGNKSEVGPLLDLAEKTGTSHPRGHFGWTDNGAVVHNGPEGWLPRNNFRDFAEAMRVDNAAATRALVEAFG